MSAPRINKAAMLTAQGKDLVIETRDIPTPQAGELLVKNRALAINPVDWKRQAFGFAISSYPVVMGVDLAGTIAAVGPQSDPPHDFAVGDSIISFTENLYGGGNDNGAFQAYSLVKAAMTSHLPSSVGFADGATLPIAFASACVGLFHHLRIPRPYSSSSSFSEGGKKKPTLLICGGSSSVGSQAVQLARQTGLVTVIATASPRNHEYVKSLGADAVVDYSSQTVARDIAAAIRDLGGAEPVSLVFDAISEGGTWECWAEVLGNSSRAEGGGAGVEREMRATFTGSPPEGWKKPEGVEAAMLFGNFSHEGGDQLREWAWHEYLPQALEKGNLVPSPKSRVVPGGLGGVQEGMNQVRKGVSAEKLVVELD